MSLGLFLFSFPENMAVFVTAKVYGCGVSGTAQREASAVSLTSVTGRSKWKLSFILIHNLDF